MGNGKHGAISRAVLASAISSMAIMASTQGARAQLVVSNDPTVNIACSAGTCFSTASQAVLNIGDLKAFLQHGDIAVAGGSAVSIVIAGNVSWPKKTKLTLNANPIYFDARVKVDGKGSITLTTNEQAGGPQIGFSKKGNIVFTNPHSQLIIDSLPYKLESNLADLIADIQTEAGIAFALIGDYDASADGTYLQAPVPGTFGYYFEGLGHTISNLHIEAASQDYVGLFREVGASGRVRDVALASVQVKSSDGSCAGSVAGNNQGLVDGVSVSGKVSAPQALATGGLVGCNFGSVFTSSAKVSVTGNIAGGLVGENAGFVTNSMASGPVTVGSGPNVPAAGGLIGETESGQVAASYSTGAVSGSGDLGGSIGDAFQGTFTDVYWDTTTSGTSTACQDSCAGVTGLTTAQLQSGLPAGFDPAIWGQNPKINGGLPYPLAAMPR